MIHVHHQLLQQDTIWFSLFLSLRSYRFHPSAGRSWHNQVHTKILKNTQTITHSRFLNRHVRLSCPDLENDLILDLIDQMAYNFFPLELELYRQ
jgi:hypothetical protein